MEYLTTARSERRAPLRILGLALALAAASVAGFLWWSDSVRSSATEELTAVFSEASARAASGERQVQGTLAYASPMIWSMEVGEEVRSGLRALVEESAADVASDLGAMRQKAADTTVLPWQEEQLAARDQVLLLIEAQQARFDGIAADASDIDLVLAGGPLPTGAALTALRAAGADQLPLR